MARIGAGLSTATYSAAAAAEAARAARQALAGASVDLALAFLSPHHLDEAEEAASAIREELEPRHFAGCVAEGVIAPATPSWRTAPGSPYGRRRSPGQRSSRSTLPRWRVRTATSSSSPACPTSLPRPS